MLDTLPFFLTETKKSVDAKDAPLAPTSHSVRIVRERGLDSYRIGAGCMIVSSFGRNYRQPLQVLAPFAYAKDAPLTPTSHPVQTVRERGLEPPCREAYGPEPYVSTNFTTRACCTLYTHFSITRTCMFLCYDVPACPGGEIGRRARLKILWL